eukprot:COSAG02_NODE_703_length_18313_cov_58.533652_3_plen_347_part_00
MDCDPREDHHHPCMATPDPGYNTWIAKENMKGTDLEVVAGAIERADVVLIAVTNEYKESASCRLEAMYAHKSEVDIIPLLVQPGYLATGWLGMHIVDKEAYELHNEFDDAKFEAQMDVVARELGDRCRPMIHEAVPSAGVEKPTTASAVAQAVAPPAPEPSSQPPDPEPSSQPRTQVPASAPVPTSIAHAPERGSADGGFSSSMQMVTMQSSLESSAMVERLLEQQRQMMREQREEMEAKLGAKDAKIEEMQAKLEPQCAISKEQLKALQERVGTLQAGERLPEDVAFMIEDLIADYIELESLMSKLTTETAQANRVVANVCKLVALSERIELDQALARQLKRKFG